MRLLRLLQRLLRRLLPLLKYLLQRLLHLLRLLLLTVPKAPPKTRRHIEERNKLFAGGCQLLALALFGTGLLAPLFNQALFAPLSGKIVIGLLVGLSESAAFAALRYIPFPDEP